MLGKILMGELVDWLIDWFIDWLIGMLRVIAEDEDDGSGGMAETRRFKTYKQYSETFANMLGKIVMGEQIDWLIDWWKGCWGW